MGNRRKARECALQMLFAADVAQTSKSNITRDFWNELSDSDFDEMTRDFANNLALGTIRRLSAIDKTIKTRAEHWRIERMAIVDRNILRLAVNEFLHESTPRTVVINESLEIARRFSTYEATQFINGILDAIKHDLDEKDPESTDSEAEEEEAPKVNEKSSSSSA
ncbi:MAG: transcription antitermination factor NusB [Pyrinomonadaceae bacterium]|nr:transcription antitermination factor NusB [Pyrinomonadaceae bacterium]